MASFHCQRQCIRISATARQMYFHAGRYATPRWHYWLARLATLNYGWRLAIGCHYADIGSFRIFSQLSADSLHTPLFSFDFHWHFAVSFHCLFSFSLFSSLLHCFVRPAFDYIFIDIAGWCCHWLFSILRLYYCWILYYWYCWWLAIIFAISLPLLWPDIIIADAIRRLRATILIIEFSELSLAFLFSSQPHWYFTLSFDDLLRHSRSLFRQPIIDYLVALRHYCRRHYCHI